MNMKHLKTIFERIRKAGLEINKKKCEFCKPQIEYLGHVVTRDGIKMNEEKVRCIRDLKAPSTKKEVRRFIVMTSWYRKFIKNYAHITAPIVKLLRKNVKFRWTENQEKAFQEVKKKLIEEPVLTRPDFTKPFTLQTDASDVGLGAVLTQEVEGNEKVVMYASRSLSPAETRYSTSEKECLAVVWGIRKMRAFLEGYHFNVLTDHQALQWLNKLKNPSGRLARWALELQQYDFDIKYRSGKQNKVADELSRNPVCLTSARSDEWYEKKIKEVEKEPSKNPEYCIRNNKLYRKITNDSYGVHLNPETEWKLCINKDEKSKILEQNHNVPNAAPVTWAPLRH